MPAAQLTTARRLLRCAITTAYIHTSVSNAAITTGSHLTPKVKPGAARATARAAASGVPMTAAVQYSHSANAAEPKKTNPNQSMKLAAPLGSLSSECAAANASGSSNTIAEVSRASRNTDIHSHDTTKAASGSASSMRSPIMRLSLRHNQIASGSVGNAYHGRICKI